MTRTENPPQSMTRTEVKHPSPPIVLGSRPWTTRWKCHLQSSCPRRRYWMSQQLHYSSEHLRRISISVFKQVAHIKINLKKERKKKMLSNLRPVREWNFHTTYKWHSLNRNFLASRINGELKNPTAS